VSTMNSGQFFAQTLKGYGTTHVFFVPSIFNSSQPAMDDLGILPVTTHHEVAAAYMADGYARASRRPGVCMAQGVGGANLAAGLREAFLSCTPVIALSGSAHPDSRYRYLYQIIEGFPMFEPVTKFNARVEKPSRLPDLLRQAYRVATTGTPGPVHLELPGRQGEVIETEADFQVIIEEQFKRAPAFRPAPDDSHVEAAARLLASAERPVILAGGGVTASGAGAELVALAEKLSIPVVTTLTGKETIPGNHPLSLGVVGTYGRWSANQALAEADLVFIAGSRVGGHATHNWRFPRPGVRTIQMDLDPAEIGRSYPAEVGIIGDAKMSLKRLIEAAKPGAGRPEWVQRAQSLRSEWWASVAPYANSDAVPLRPERVCKEVSEFLPEDAVMVIDTGHAAIWSGTMVDLNKPGQRYIRCAGTLGWSFPASIGVKCALPNQPVLCFAGDGGFCYHIAELETAARLGINVVVLVNNNRALSQTKKLFDGAYGGTQRGRARDMWVFGEVDFPAVAEAMGCLGLKVEKPGELKPALERAFSANRPVVIDVKTDIEAFPQSPSR